MTTPHPKRRRLDATAQLNKPFRSPFKTPFKSPVKGLQEETTQASTPLKEETTNEQSNCESAQPIVLTAKSTNTLLQPNRPTPGKKHIQPSVTNFLPQSSPKASLGTPSKKKFTSPIVTKQLNNDPDIAPVLRLQKDLERQLREIKEELDAAEQALKIEGASRKWNVANGRDDGDEEELEIDGELVELCHKWREASRRAAEELFTNVRERVNRMGGPRAWKAAQKKREEDMNAWDQEDNNDNEDSDSEDEDGNPKPKAEKRDVYAEYGIDPETENEKNQRLGKGVQDTSERAGDEDEFTMGMMLRTLNVEYKVIGWDRDGQRWSD